jgi:hypothetical protein
VPAVSALSAVSQGIYAALNVSALTSVAGATGGVHETVPQNTAFPFVLYDVSEDWQHAGLGTKPGDAGRVIEIRLRLYVYSDQDMKTCQTILAAAIGLLADPPSATGFSSWAIFWDDAMPIPDSVIAGRQVKELTANARLYVQPT